MRARVRDLLFFIFFVFSGFYAPAQSNSGTVSGTVTDPSGAVVSGASISIENPVSAYSRAASTDKAGHFQFTGLPFNPYHLSISGAGFSTSSQDVDVRSAVPVVIAVALKVGAAASTVTVEGGQDLVEKRFHISHRHRSGSFSQGTAGEPILIP